MTNKGLNLAPATPLPVERSRASPASLAESAQYNADVNNPIRRLGLNLARVFLFFRFSGLHEVVTVKFGFNTYVLYIFGVPAILCLILSNGFARTMRARQAKYWVGFACFLIASTPFSDWRGASVPLVMTYMRTDFIVLFLIAGLVMTWSECWRMLSMLSIAAVVTILLGQFFKAETMGGDDRLSVASGLTMGNANDYAAVLALLLPFLALVVITPGRNILLRGLATAGFLFGLYMMLSTGSRGGGIAILAALVLTIFRLPPIKAIGVTVVALVIALAMFQILPRNITERLVTFLQSDNAAMTDATESGESRQYLLEKSLLYTVQHPLFGVGPGEFPDHEGLEATAAGQHGNWHATHNTYTQVSSEVGIPAAFFFITALFSSYRLLSRTLKQIRRRQPSLQNATMAAGVVVNVLIGTVAFCFTSFFLSLAYRFYFPALTGIAIVLCAAVTRELGLDQRNPYAVR